MPESEKTVLTSLRSHWRSAVVLLLLDCAIWAVCRFLFLDAASPDLWQDQLVLFQGLLLLDTLLVVWWYTDVTAQLAKTNESQLRQAAMAERVRNKPVAVAVLHPLASGGFEYRVRNIGPGLAVGVWCITGSPDDQFERVCLGALGPGDSRALPSNLLRPLCDERTVRPFAVLAEGMWTRTAQWTLTVNLRGDNPGSDVLSHFVPIADSQMERSIDQLLLLRNQGFEHRSRVSVAAWPLAPPNNALEPTANADQCWSAVVARRPRLSADR